MRRRPEIETLIRERLRRFGRAATIDQIVELIPEAPRERTVFALASMVARESLTRVESEGGVALYAPASKWGGGRRS